MRLAFISDIHGNAIALESVIKDLQSQKVDKVFVLGDISYRGLEPQRSLDLVKELTSDIIKGNADEWVVRGIREGEVPEQVLAMMRREREWIVSNMKDEGIEFLKNLPTDLTIEEQGIKVHAFHATPNSLFDVVNPDQGDDVLQETLMQQESDIYIYAHIHKPYIRYVKGKVVMNIGSVGLPFDGITKSSYGLVEIENGKVQTSIVRVDYDLDQVIDQLEKSDYPNKELVINLLKNGAM